MDVFARLRKPLCIEVTPETVTLRYERSCFTWRSTICLEPQSRSIYDIGKEACAEPDGVFVDLFRGDDAVTDARWRTAAMENFFIYGAVLAREGAFIDPYAEVSGLASFDPRERDRIRAELARVLGHPKARLRSVRFLD